MMAWLVRVICVVILATTGSAADETAAVNRTADQATTVKVDPLKLDFGSLPVADASPPMTTTLSNVGNAPVRIVDITASGIDPLAIEQLLASRTDARARKDFRESDRIRDELAAMGVVLKDGKDADGKPITTWEIAR